eukprot:Skav201818  [mRNA]  locus=scaffold1071:339519:340715:+ [translate_table: standard]
MREQTAAVGTDLYHAPEYGKKMYDSEKADVFTEFAQFNGADGLKALINCLWALTPEKRPTFRELQAAMAGDKDILEAFPGAMER